MNSKDAYDIALKLTDIYFKILQFFIAICTLFGGWIVVKGLPVGLFDRALLAVIFTGATATMLAGALQTIGRINAALETSQSLFVEETRQEKKLDGKLFARGGSVGTLVGMGCVIATMNLLIFIAKHQTSL